MGCGGCLSTEEYTPIVLTVEHNSNQTILRESILYRADILLFLLPTFTGSHNNQNPRYTQETIYTLIFTDHIRSWLLCNPVIGRWWWCGCFVTDTMVRYHEPQIIGLRVYDHCLLTGPTTSCVPSYSRVLINDILTTDRTDTAGCTADVVESGKWRFNVKTTTTTTTGAACTDTAPQKYSSAYQHAPTPHHSST